MEGKNTYFIVYRIKKTEKNGTSIFSVLSASKRSGQKPVIHPAAHSDNPIRQ